MVFKVGDVVRFKQEGAITPLMTIEEVYAPDKKCWCVWFDSIGALHRADFQASQLLMAVKS